MSNNSTERSIIIIGGGFAGLAAGIYARMNGYNTEIFEMHDKPGGLCTSWKRKGYTIDGCIHWLVGSSPESGMHDMWEEVGIAQGRQFIYLDEYSRFEDKDGRVLVFYTDIDRLEKHLLEFSPRDSGPIKDFIRGIRMCLHFDPTSKNNHILLKFRKGLKTVIGLIRNYRALKRWMNTTASDFSDRFKDPLLREAMKEIWIPEFSMFFMLFTFAYMHSKNAGYPIGGSMPMSQALANRYLQLGGTIHYNKRVEKILVKNDCAFGIRLTDGSEHFAGRIISAADGYNTIYKMLDGKYGYYRTSEPYERWKLFPPLIYIGLGVNRLFDDEPASIGGFLFNLDMPVKIGEKMRDWLPVHIFNYDPTLAPEGKTSIVLMIPTSYDYWEKLYVNKMEYKSEKEQIAKTVIEVLGQRFPGIGAQVEMVDVATPMTFERYTGNWKGSFEGWLITPDNSKVLMKKMPQTIEGLKNFYMCGQWVEPGGGLPTSIMSGRRLIRKLCKQDRRRFLTTIV